MTGPAWEDKRLISRFAFPPEFIGFQGHFPEKKILPGVCQIQCALSMLEKGGGKAVDLKEVVVAKYFAPVFPDDEVTCVVSDIGGPGDEFTVRAVLTKDSVKIAELKLRVAFGHPGSKP